MKFLSCLINNNIFVFSIFFIFSLLLAISIWLFFPVSSSGIHYYSIGLYILLALGIAIFISYKKDLSIPLIKKVLEREYHRVKFKHCKKEKKPIIIRIYLETLYYLILLFKSSEESFYTLKEDIFIEFSELADGIKEKKKKRSIFVRAYLKFLRYSKSLFKSSKGGPDILKDNVFVKMSEVFVKMSEIKDEIDEKFERVKRTMKRVRAGEEVDKASLAELEKELFEFSKFKQKRVTVFSLTAISALIITTVATGLISSFFFPEVFKTRAASYGFLQTDWSGGVSSDTGLHPGDQASWNKYFSKDNVSTSTPGELSLDLETTEIWSQTLDSDWNTHATSSTYYSGGSVGILRPNGAACSAVLECSSGFCVNGYCCDTACTGTTCQRCDSYSNAGAGTCGYVNSSTEDPDNECGTTNCGSGNCKGDSYVCGWLTSGNGNCAVCQTCVGATSESCQASANGTSCGGGIKFAAGLVAMPGGCADDTSEPTCSGTDSVTKAWAGSEGFNEPADSTSDGASNTTNLVNDAQTYNCTAQYCYDMVYLGYSDWYLPAKDQLNTLDGQRIVVGGFANAAYWSSTEYSISSAWYEDFPGGGQHYAGKSNTAYVRCIRSY